MYIKEIDNENNTFIDESDVEHMVPPGCQGMEEKDIQKHLDIAEIFIEKFIKDNGYGEIIDI